MPADRFSQRLCVPFRRRYPAPPPAPDAPENLVDIPRRRPARPSDNPLQVCLRLMLGSEPLRIECMAFPPLSTANVLARKGLSRRLAGGGLATLASGRRPVFSLHRNIHEDRACAAARFERREARRFPLGWFGTAPGTHSYPSTTCSTRLSTMLAFTISSTAAATTSSTTGRMSRGRPCCRARRLRPGR